ncbi:MAG: hypothetical protein WAO61_05115 [Solirubrobacterales bacterium]
MEKSNLSNSMSPPELNINYEVDSEAVAEAIIRRVNHLAEERAKYRRALMRSVEMVVSGDNDRSSVSV